ncbi:MAG: HAMP domain-containing histidine kinase [Acidimicrobiia bacterium]|nr:HAMP domain-containing histidine kinase [Acidimicrobiia bacterium]
MNIGRLLARARGGLRARLIVGFAAVSVMVTAAVSTGTYLLSERYLMRERTETATRQSFVDARLVREVLVAENTTPRQALERVELPVGAQALINRGDEWFGSSVAFGEDSLPIELRRKARDGVAASQRSDLLGELRLVVATPVPSIDLVYYEIVSLDELERTLAVIRSSLMVAAVGTGLAAALVGWWASRRIIRPVAEVSAASARIAGGDLTARLGRQRDAQLQRVSRSFNAMADALQRRIDRDARFASDVSHELRSPLTTLATAADVLAGERESMTPRAAEAADLIATETTRFRRVLEELLELGRADAGADLLEIEDVPLGELVLAIVGSISGGDCVVELAPNVAGTRIATDRRRVTRILTNLLENARTYGLGASLVTVDRDLGVVRISVEDKGPGVPIDQRDAVFERFSRGATAGRRGSEGSASGAGLGLAIVAEHARSLGGRVWVEDGAGGVGARFVVEIPA